MREKKLVVRLACGHTLTLTKREAVNFATGNHAECRKCDYRSRRVLERAWVAGSEV